MAIEFDAANPDHVNCGDFLRGITKVSVSLWTKPTTTTHDHDLFVKANTHSTSQPLVIWRDEYGAGDRYAVLCNDGNDASGVFYTVDGSAANAGIWDHLVVTIDMTNQELRFYINGVPDASNPQAIPVAVNYIQDDVDPIRLGGTLTAGKELDGLLLEVAVWDAILTGAEALMLYSGGLPVHRMPHAIQPSNLQGYWPCNDRADGVEVVGAVVRDHSGNGHTGTDYGAPVFRAAPISTLGAGPISVLAPAEVVVGDAMPMASNIYRRRRVA